MKMVQNNFVYLFIYAIRYSPTLSSATAEGAYMCSQCQIILARILYGVQKLGPGM
jgi:hypothetical protein